VDSIPLQLPPPKKGEKYRVFENRVLKGIFAYRREEMTLTGGKCCALVTENHRADLHEIKNWGAYFSL
jgi:hypothetical protein